MQPEKSWRSTEDNLIEIDVCRLLPEEATKASGLDFDPNLLDAVQLPASLRLRIDDSLELSADGLSIVLRERPALNDSDKWDDPVRITWHDTPLVWTKSGNGRF